MRLPFFQPAFLWMLSLVFATSAIAQSPDVPEPGSTEAIAAATTDPHFVSPWVAYVPQSSKVPSPEKFLGRITLAPSPRPARGFASSPSGTAKKGARF